MRWGGARAALEAVVWGIAAAHIAFGRVPRVPSARVLFKLSISDSPPPSERLPEDAEEKGGVVGERAGWW